MPKKLAYVLQLHSVEGLYGRNSGSRDRNDFVEVEGQGCFLTPFTLHPVEEHRRRDGSGAAPASPGRGWFLCSASCCPPSPAPPPPRMPSLRRGPLPTPPPALTPSSPSYSRCSAFPSRSGQDTLVCSGPEAPQPSRHPAAPHRR